MLMEDKCQVAGEKKKKKKRYHLQDTEEQKKPRTEQNRAEHKHNTGSLRMRLVKDFYWSSDGIIDLNSVQKVTLFLSAISRDGSRA